MPETSSAAETLVFRAISAEERAPRADRQDLPSLDLIGAAIARAARLAAAEDRARHAYSIMQRSQAAELLRAARDAAQAAIGRPQGPSPADAPADEGRVIPPTARPAGFVWRFHPAPEPVGAPIASTPSGAFA